MQSNKQTVQTRKNTHLQYNRVEELVISYKHTEFGPRHYTMGNVTLSCIKIIYVSLGGRASLSS